MSEPLFVSQTKLEEWIDKGEVTFEDDVLTLLAHGTSYRMVAAAKVTTILDGHDEAGLLGNVWTIEDLERRGAEYMHDSIILGDTAYQCDPGFVGQKQVAPQAASQPEPAVAAPLPPSPASPTAPARPATGAVPPPLPKQTRGNAPPPAVKPEEKESDMDLLTDFLLKNL